MVEQGRGHIINIASMAGKITTTNSNVYAAVVSMIGFSDALRHKLADKGSHCDNNSNLVQLRHLSSVKLILLEPYLESVKKFVLSLNTWLKKIIRILGKNKREVNLRSPLAAH